MTKSELFDASKSGNLTTLKKLFDSGVNLNDKDEDGNTALIIAASKGHLRVVNYLIGMDSSETLNLILEWKRNNKELSEEYIRQWKVRCKSVNINAKNKLGETALMIAAGNKDYEMVKLLIDAGSDVNLRNDIDETPLLYAIRNGCTDMVKWMIDAGADVNVISKYRITDCYNTYFKCRDTTITGGESALILAVESGSSTITKWLIDAGADINIVNKHNETPLMIAKKKEFHNIEKYLKEASLSLNKDKE